MQECSQKNIRGGIFGGFPLNLGRFYANSNGKLVGKLLVVVALVMDQQWREGARSISATL